MTTRIFTLLLLSGMFLLPSCKNASGSNDKEPLSSEEGNEKNNDEEERGKLCLLFKGKRVYTLGTTISDLPNAIEPKESRSTFFKDVKEFNFNHAYYSSEETVQRNGNQGPGSTTFYTDDEENILYISNGFTKRKISEEEFKDLVKEYIEKYIPCFSGKYNQAMEKGKATKKGNGFEEEISVSYDEDFESWHFGYTAKQKGFELELKSRDE